MTRITLDEYKELKKENEQLQQKNKRLKDTLLILLNNYICYKKEYILKQEYNGAIDKIEMDLFELEKEINNYKKQIEEL